ncbi:MAG: zinc-dependent metalloprotease [Bacteroidia bacterium]
MKKIKLLTILLIIFTALPFLTFSQNEKENFISLRQENSLRMSAPEANKINVMKQNKFYKSVQMVTIGNLPQILNDNNGSLPIELPGTRKTYIVKEKNFNYESDLNYEWVGTIKGRDIGEIIIICTEGSISGQVFINDKAFVIQSFNKETSVLVEYNEKEMERGSASCGTKSAGIAEAINSGEVPANITREQHKIKVAVFYTPAAASAGDMNSIAALAISQMNQAFSNSGITNAVMELTGGPMSYNFTETDNYENDLNTFKTDASVQAIRNYVNADVVVLLTGAYSSVFGIAASVTPDNANAYALVQASAAASNRYTFAHEIGHLFGCRHDNDNTVEPLTYNHGYVFWTGSFFRKTNNYTMMAVAPSNIGRLLNYSNPDVTYKGKKTGTADKNNNAQRILYTSGTVSCFRDCLPPFYVGISGPSKGYNSGNYTWSVNDLTGGIAPYTYDWEYTLNGTNWSSFGNTASITAQLPNNYDLNLRLTVVSSIGQVASATHYTMNLGDDPHGHYALNQSDLNNDLKKSDSENKLSEDRGFNLYPNPNNGTFTLNLQQNSAESNIYVADIFGKVVFEKQHNTDINVNINLSNMSKGIYIVRVVDTKGDTEVKKVVVQ